MNHNASLTVHSLLLSICPQDLLYDSEQKFVFFALSLFSGYILLVSLSGFPNTEYRFYSPRGLQTSLHQLSGSLLSDVQDQLAELEGIKSMFYCLHFHCFLTSLNSHNY